MVTIRIKYATLEFPKKVTIPFERKDLSVLYSGWFTAAKICLVTLTILFSFSSFSQVQTGASQFSRYLTFLKGKKVGLVVNQTSIVGNIWLPDTLNNLGINVKRIFAPEHGVKGKSEAGKKIDNSFVLIGKTKVPIVSLYGKKKKPDSSDLNNLDVIVYDIQDVGVRFFTYISTLHYIMEACSYHKIKLIVLDRPNPNGHYIDGPILDTAFRSFVGIDPIPIVYGLTVGELSLMIKGEGWIPYAQNLDLQVIPCKQYDHLTAYTCPVPPSPNLKTPESIFLYPSLGLFEGTDVSVGRGTNRPFELIGKPNFKEGRIKFTPISIPGVSENPPYKNKECSGFDLQTFCTHYLINSRQLYLYWLTGFYKQSDSASFFNPFFDKLAGTDILRNQIIQGVSEDQIRASWQPGLTSFMEKRRKYLLYNDFY